MVDKSLIMQIKKANKVLMIEDESERRRVFERELGDLLDAPHSIEEIERLLKDTQYALILLDHDLKNSGIRKGLKERISGFENPQYLNGGDIFRNIRSGGYGELNQQTPIYSISRKRCEYAPFFNSYGNLQEEIDRAISIH